MLCVIGLIPYMLPPLAMPLVSASPRAKEVSKAMDAIDHAQSSITELTYRIMLGIIGLASMAHTALVMSVNSINPCRV
jgi:hypothetical protein